MRRARAAVAATRLAIAPVAVAALLLLATWDPGLSAEAQRRFPSPEEAVRALVEATRASEPAALLAVLGPDARPLIASGDDVADQRSRERFLRAYEQGWQLVAAGEARAVLAVGQDGWRLPIPLVREGGSWRFDTAQGRREILDRRIGRNELSAIQVCLAYVDAQREYYVRQASGGPLLAYAQRFGSTPGRRDGLYWEAAPGEPPSPLGPLVARAQAAGYRPGKGGQGPHPYWGYYYRILTAQGSHAPGGAYDYVVRGQMIGGFALVAFPAEYGASGVMTFIVSHDGVVYQKNLGPQTSAVARAMTRFDPDPSWTRVETGAPGQR
jgi:hypothetical protein